MRRNRSVVGLLTAFLLLVSGSATASIQLGGGEGAAANAKADQFEVDAARPAGTTVRLAAGTFDPLDGGELDLDAALRAVAPRHWIVQLHGPVTAAARAAVEATGARVLDYVPDVAYVVAADAATATLLRTLPAVRWVGAYHPAYKISRALADFDGGDLRVYVHEDVSPADAAAAIGAVDGVKVQEVGRRIATVHAPAAAVADLARIEHVEWVEPRPQYQLHNGNALWVSDTGERDERGVAKPGRLDGAGQTAAVADTGVNYVPDDNGKAQRAFSDCAGGACKLADYVAATPGNTDEALASVTATGEHHRKMAGYFNLDADDPEARSTEPSWHGTHVAGSVAADYPDAAGAYGARSRESDGMAPAARLVFQDIEAAGGLGGLPSDQYDLFDQVYDLNGNDQYDPLEDARTHNNSYGSLVPMVDDGSGMRTDDFVHEHEDMTIVFSASNDGPEIFSLAGGPQEAKNILVSCASANGRQPLASPDTVAVFSSHGPTFDGRIKPDVCTPGQIVVSPKGGTTDDDQYLQGTSMSGPVLVGLVTLVRQYFWDGFGPAGGSGFAGGSRDAANRHNPSAALVKAATINSAQRMRGWYSGDRGGERSQDGMWPSGGQGWGKVQLDEALYFSGDDRSLFVEDRPNTPETGLETGGEVVRTVDVAPGQPLDLTLAWTDPSNAMVVGTPVLVNDLDLVLRAPDGTEYAGNEFTTQTPILGSGGDPAADEGESVPGGDPDTANNVERVRLADPAPGRYEIVVRGANVADGPQGYALVASGRVATDTNRIVFDAPEYGRRDAGTAYLLGTGLSGAEVDGFRRIAPSVYERTFVARDRQVQLTAGGVSASAPVDNSGPTARDVSVRSMSADLARFTWQTNEPTAGEVVIRSDDGEERFPDVYVSDGLSGMETPQNETSGVYLDRKVVSPRHEVNVTGLDPGGTYTYRIVGTDESGNRSTLASGTFTSSDAVYATAANDQAMLLSNDTTAGTPAVEQGWGTSTQFYTGSFATTVGGFVGGTPASTSKALPAFMFRLPESVDPSRITGAAVQLQSAHDVVNTYVIDDESPKTHYSLDLLDSGVEGDWGPGTTYDEVANASADAHFVPEMTERRGANVPYTFHLPCNELDQLRGNLGEDSGERRAAFRLEGLSEQPESLFSFEYGFGRRSRGPQLRPRLLLFLDGADPERCEETAAPKISRVLVDHVTEDSAVVSWRTNVPADSTVYFRERGTKEWTPVSAPVRTTQHFVRVGGLEPYGAYEFVVKSKTCNGKETVDSNGGKAYALFNEAYSPPVVSGVHARPTGTPGEAVVGWRTDQPTTGVVRYGLSPDDLDHEAPSDAEEPGTEHTVTLTDLEPCTRYYFSAVGENRAGSSAASPVMAFDTIATDPEPVAAFTFDDGAGGWAGDPPEGNGNQSEPGLGSDLGPNPTAWALQPESSTGGSPAWRTVLADTGTPGYSSNVDIRLVSPPVEVPAGAALLEWKQWYSLEHGVEGVFTPLDRVVAEVSTDGGSSWQAVHTPPAGGTNDEFPDAGVVRVPLPAQLTGRTIQVAFHFISDSNTEPPAGGWAIDDVNLFTLGCDDVAGVVPGVPVAPATAPSGSTGDSTAGNPEVGPVAPISAGAASIGKLPNATVPTAASLAAGTSRCGAITYRRGT